MPFTRLTRHCTSLPNCIFFDAMSMEKCYLNKGLSFILYHPSEPQCWCHLDLPVGSLLMSCGRNLNFFRRKTNSWLQLEKNKLLKKEQHPKKPPKLSWGRSYLSFVNLRSSTIYPKKTHNISIQPHHESVESMEIVC